MLLLYCSIYTYELADATLQGDQEQLEWIKDGRAGKGERIRMFKTYPKSYIDGLEEKLLLEQNHMRKLVVEKKETPDTDWFAENPIIGGSRIAFTHADQTPLTQAEMVDLKESTDEAFLLIDKADKAGGILTA